MSISVLLRWSTQVFFKYQSTFKHHIFTGVGPKICADLFYIFIGIIELQISCFPSNSHKVR